ncbi:TlpA family protein disulfide reductase [Marinicella litoralis]|nr:TlpA disulfide reductase family protein [Marinicella litoralis]
MKNNFTRIRSCLILLTTGLALSACTEPDKATTESTKSEVQVASQKKATTSTAETKNDQTANDGIDGPLAFTLNDLAGNEVNAEDYRGKWLVLNYWATWCAPCRDEIPELVKFQNENTHVQILGIAYEDAEVNKLKNFADDFGVNYPLLTIDVYNPPGFAEEGGMGLPTTIVYNPQGMRHKKHMGPIDAAGLLQMIQ